MGVRSENDVPHKKSRLIASGSPTEGHQRVQRPAGELNKRNIFDFIKSVTFPKLRASKARKSCQKTTERDDTS